jgi:hypothetical protein
MLGDSLKEKTHAMKEKSAIFSSAARKKETA